MPYIASEIFDSSRWMKYPDEGRETHEIKLLNNVRAFIGMGQYCEALSLLHKPVAGKKAEKLFERAICCLKIHMTDRNESYLKQAETDLTALCLEPAYFGTLSPIDQMRALHLYRTFNKKVIYPKPILSAWEAYKSYLKELATSVETRLLEHYLRTTCLTAAETSQLVIGYLLLISMHLQTFSYDRAKRALKDLLDRIRPSPIGDIVNCRPILSQEIFAVLGLHIIISTRSAKKRVDYFSKFFVFNDMIEILKDVDGLGALEIIEVPWLIPYVKFFQSYIAESQGDEKNGHLFLTQSLASYKASRGQPTTWVYPYKWALAVQKALL